MSDIIIVGGYKWKSNQINFGCILWSAKIWGYYGEVIWKKLWKHFCTKVRNWKNLCNLCKWLFLSYFFFHCGKCFHWNLYKQQTAFKKKKRASEGQKAKNGKMNLQDRNIIFPSFLLIGNTLFYYRVIIAIISLLFHNIICLIVLQPLVLQIPAVAVGNV